jgi:SNF2 family DNA or RNA helicase
MPKAFARPSKDAQDAALAKAQSIAAGLFPHQVEGVAFLLGRRKAILADDMGLGKTRQSIVALRAAEPDGPYLIVCPASLKQNWAREIQMVEPDAAVHVVDSRNGVSGTRWTVINYDILNKHIQALGSSSGFRRAKAPATPRRHRRSGRGLT